MRNPDRVRTMEPSARALINFYADRLGWSADETVDILASFFDREENVDHLRRLLREETGVDLEPDEWSYYYEGKPFAVLAYPEGDSSAPVERIDVESEVLALEAFSTLLSEPGLEEFVVLQFNPNSRSSRELLRYSRRSAGAVW